MSYLNTLKGLLDPLHGVSASVRRDFIPWYMRTKVPQIRYVAFLTMALYFVYAPIEYHVATDQQGLRLLVHGVVIPGALLAVALLSYNESLRRPMLGILTTAPVVAVASNLYFNSQSSDFAYYVPEIYLSLMWIFAVSGLSLREATPTACTSLFILLAVTLGHTAQSGINALHFLWILASFSFGLLCAFLLEKAHKSMFLQQHRLALLASIDGLTGLSNRSHIDQFLDDQIARTARYGGSLSVITLDIDHFKRVNDSHGYAVGDHVLCQFATLLKSHVREVDWVGRRGGEEFLVVLPETNGDHALTVAQLLQQRINAFDFERIGHNTASFGVTELRPGDSLAELLERGDRALYKAKANGRNRIEADVLGQEMLKRAVQPASR
ncbi:GGDEF domain-containing protein [Pseudomonas sp. EL_65y_Pfl2_R95]|uniref:GGDEF domain-containing protein n=1 Tax=Pseudomonas sp. EL_65y_Pfl2_R95 TaxID=3088698 RepID=UPI0030DD9AC1